MPDHTDPPNARPAEPDIALVRRAMRGDRTAFAELVHRHIRLVVAAASASVGPQEAEDLAQDVFVEAWARLKTLRDENRFTAWLVGITRRMAVYRLRRKKRSEEVFDDIGNLARNSSAPPPTPALQAEHNEALSLLEEELQSLPEPYREVILLRYMANLGIDDIARLLGISRAACDKRLTRAKARLKDALRKKLGDR